MDYYQEYSPEWLQWLKQQKPALARIIEQYETSTGPGPIRYSDYLEYEPSSPKVELPSAWVIAYIAHGGGYLIPETRWNRDRIAFRVVLLVLLVALAALVFSGWILLWGSDWLLAALNTVIGAAIILLIAINWWQKRAVAKTYLRITFPDELTRALRAINWGG